MTQTTIDRDTYLRAFALFTTACDLSRQYNVLREQLARVLGLPDRTELGWIDEAMWDEDGSASEFDKALEKDGFIVIDDTLIEAARSMVATLERANEAKDDPIFGDAADLIRQLAARPARSP